MDVIERIEEFEKVHRFLLESFTSHLEEFEQRLEWLEKQVGVKNVEFHNPKTA